MNEYECKKCHKIFTIDKQPIERKGIRKRIKCPFCNKRYDLLTFSNQYIKLENGQLINRFNKIKMSKKQRRKLKTSRKTNE